jgi:hypothetical protein
MLLDITAQKKGNIMKVDAHADGAGWGTLASIVEKYEEIHNESNNADNDEDAHKWAVEQPLSVLVKSGWTEVGKPMHAYEFELLMGSGGPAVRITGDLDEMYQPEAGTIRLEVQNWGTPWVALTLMDNAGDADPIKLADHRRAALHWFASNFYYGG